MKLTILLISAMMSLSTLAPIGKSPDIVLIQDGKVLKMKKNKTGIYDIHLKPESFSIVYKHKELMVSGGLNEELFLVAKPNTDISADFRSNFYIGKFLALAKDTDYLPLNKDEAANLNGDKGAQTLKNGKQSFTVNQFYQAGELQPLTAFDSVCLALWLDTNLDLFIDKKELLQVKLHFTK